MSGVTTYPLMEDLPVTWTKLTLCPDHTLGGSDKVDKHFSEMRVMSDPESIVTSVLRGSSLPICADTVVERDPKK